MNTTTTMAGVFRIGAARAAQARTLERLSTGLAINRASDNPAGLIAAERLGADIAGLRAAIDTYERSAAALGSEEAALGAGDAGDASETGSAEARAAIGIEQRALESQRRSAEVELVNAQAARSSIRDADFGAETSDLARHTVVFRSAMLALRLAQDTSGSLSERLIGGVLDRRA